MPWGVVMVLIWERGRLDERDEQAVAMVKMSGMIRMNMPLQ